MMDETRHIWKIRVVKSYADARNHVLIGQMIGRDTMCVSLKCRTFHFGRSANVVKDIQMGPVDHRIIPWNRIEIINLLPSSFEYESAQLANDPKGNIFFQDGHYACPVVTNQDRHI